jgi:predicted metal-dependent HD superfamily phosphohydrolase
MNYQDSLKMISDQAIRLYQANADDRLFYHNLAHTNRLLDAINKLQAHYQLDDKNLFIVSSAAWLADLEIINSGSISHEIKTTAFTEKFLESQGMETALIDEIKNCILVVSKQRPAVSLNEKIICDAGSFYFGSASFAIYNKLMRREIEAFTQVNFRGVEWRDKTISMLENHQYLTEFCQSLLNRGKQDNLQSLIRIQEKKQNQKYRSDGKFQSSDDSSDTAGHPTKTKHHLRGVETMFRNSSSNHMRLSVMADNKAFIMISVNSILISVGIGLIIGKFVLINKLFIPTVLLLTVNVITIIYSVLATRPGVMKGTFTREELDNKTVDLLFFGSFYKMPLEEYKYGMKQMMDDSDFLYGTIIKDIYLQARTLGRKFRLLRYSYNIFMYGMAFTVLVYIASFLL